MKFRADKPVSNETGVKKAQEIQAVLRGDVGIEETSLSDIIIPDVEMNSMEGFDRRQRELESKEIHRDDLN